MSIQQPRRFVTTDQGHADVLNVPIDTLYANDQELVAQVESIKKDPAGNGIASKEALDQHTKDTTTHITGVERTKWNSIQSASEQFTKDYAALKQHSHPASDLPSASTQARGIVQLSTSVSSSATDQAATPSAVKSAYDLANAGQRVKVTADEGQAQDISWKDLNVNRPTGWYMGSNMGNAPSADWYWVEEIKHNDIWCLQKAYNFNNTNTHIRYMRNGSWSQWSAFGGGNMVLVSSNNVKISSPTTYSVLMGASGQRGPSVLGFKFVPKALGEIRIYCEVMVEITTGTVQDSNFAYAVAEVWGSDTYSSDGSYVENSIGTSRWDYREPLGTTKAVGTNSWTEIGRTPSNSFNTWHGMERTLRVSNPGPVYVALNSIAGTKAGGNLTIKSNIRNIQVCYDEVTP
ncbi:MAG: tail fiber protein [Bacillota bacterium]